MDAVDLHQRALMQLFAYFWSQVALPQLNKQVSSAFSPDQWGHKFLKQKTNTKARVLVKINK